jgi:hypothetical protein
MKTALVILAVAFATLSCTADVPTTTPTKPLPPTPYRLIANQRITDGQSYDYILSKVVDVESGDTILLTRFYGQSAISTTFYPKKGR